MKKRIHIIIFLFISLVFVSCDKGYTVRFTNYSLEPMDSVIVGNNAVVFTNVEIQTVTDYRNIKHGQYNIECVTKSKKRFYSNMFISSKGSGTRSIQMDGTYSVVVLEQ